MRIRNHLKRKREVVGDENADTEIFPHRIGFRFALRSSRRFYSRLIKYGYIIVNREVRRSPGEKFPVGSVDFADFKIENGLR